MKCQQYFSVKYQTTLSHCCQLVFFFIRHPIWMKSHQQWLKYWLQKQKTTFFQQLYPQYKNTKEQHKFDLVINGNNKKTVVNSVPYKSEKVNQALRKYPAKKWEIILAQHPKPATSCVWQLNRECESLYPRRSFVDEFMLKLQRLRPQRQRRVQPVILMVFIHMTQFLWTSLPQLCGQGPGPPGIVKELISRKECLQLLHSWIIQHNYVE